MSAPTPTPTPGPWTVGGGYPKTVYAKCVPIATAHDGKHYDWLEGANFLGEQVAQANARLIAAAPDLLRELKHLALLLEPALNNGRVQVPGLATLNGAWLAIAKATGLNATDSKMTTTDAPNATNSETESQKTRAGAHGRRIS